MQNKEKVATFHLSAKPISRSAGRSATGAAAYRAGVEITDERTGQVHNYTRKTGVLHSKIILPEGGTANRSEFWNAIEKHHKRGDAVLAREVEISLPTELTKEERQALAMCFASELSDRYGVAVDVALHAPRAVTNKDLKKDPDQYHETDPETGRQHNGNWHAHLMLSACHVSPTGELSKKSVALDPIHCQRAKIENMVDRERVRWAQLANGALERYGHTARVDHRSLEEQGVDREPTKHLGLVASGYERRTGEPSQKRQDFEQEAFNRLARAAEVGELERQGVQLDRSIIDLSGDLRAAKAEMAAAELIRQKQAVDRKLAEAAKEREARRLATQEKSVPEQKPPPIAAQVKKTEVVLKTAQEPELAKPRKQIKLDWQNRLDVLGDEYRQEGIKAARLKYESFSDELEPRIQAHNATKKPMLFGIDKWEAERSSLLEKVRSRESLKDKLNRLEKRFEEYKKLSFQEERYNANEKEWCEVNKRAREKYPELWATFQAIQKEEAAERRKALEQKEREETKQSPDKGRGR
jgi:hypothetical protein